MNHSLISRLQSIVGNEKVATNQRRTEHYRTGFRSGGGSALAVVFPDSLLKLWQVLQACVDANVIIIMQAANTGLTEGSTPSGEDYDREVVVINTLAMDDLVLLNGGEQVLGFPGATLHKLEKLLKPLKRAPHSVIGSSCLGASIVGGVANNSGGALVKRGPAYTEMALFARVNALGKLELVNHLGVELGETPEEILTRLASGDFVKDGVDDGGKLASDREYVERLRDVDAATPARFNADERRLFEASGCAGKVAVFAVRLDTFPVAQQEQTFYIGTNDPQVLTRLRRHLLGQFANVPDVGEYMHRDIFNIAEKYGKDTFLTIEKLGTDWMPKLFAIKGRTDATLNKLPLLPKFLSDRVMQGASCLFPQHLPQRLLAFRDRYEHHLILKMSDGGIAEARAFLPGFFADPANAGGYFECTSEEASKAYLQRFAAAGAAIRYQTVHSQRVGAILALDIALRRNDENWVEQLPESISSQLEQTLYYGHFMCHVFHQDYILKKGADAKAVKKAMLALLDTRGAKYPAEHNVGHLYEAESGLREFYKRLDPTNTFNPGIGKMEKYRRNCSCCG
ncbi:MAG: D-lactate dehydrogenase [Gammaproteobacteria bacterium]|nr:D-lactate dehydrogenase [Gammaproteobacteria bacterium]MBU1722263.1 D-lactate dehydrogenase [Gammaproteobacteria bacterium]MBU2005370.1 D-lactate dehydrogenase [Gammaproteobacteria bacterium]